MSTSRHTKLGLLAIALIALAACTPSVGLSAPFYGDAVFNEATSNYEGHMTACNSEGGPVTVMVGDWGFDPAHPFEIDVTDAQGVVIATRLAYGSGDVLVTQPLVLGSCFGVQITTPGTTGRGYFSYTVVW